MRRSGFALAFVTALAVSVAAARPAPGIREKLDRAAELARTHDYPEVLALLEPELEREDLATSERFEVLSQVGRARFHLGRYNEAYRALAAAVRLQPRSVEAALYLEGAAWATGRHGQALSILDALLSSGASDLFLAITLPGERGFLADPSVWEVLARHERPLVVDVRRGLALGAPLGGDRETVLAVLPGAPPETGREIILRAGPKVVWALRFDDSGRLEEVVIDCQNLLRYTPYRLAFACSLDWRTTPDAVRTVLGEPVSDRNEADGGRVLSWELGRVRTGMEFGPPSEPRPAVIPEGSVMLRLLRMVLRPAEDTREAERQPGR